MATKKNKKAIVYIDGLNLYYGLLKKTPYKWLDIYKFVESYLSIHSVDILCIKNFCARVGSVPYDLTAPLRQGAYLSALQNKIPGDCHYECIEGYFKYGVRKTGLDTKTGNLVTIETSEEKGTDVNIGVHITHDSHTKRDFDIVCLVSNDTDLSEAVRLAKEAGKIIYIIPPIRKYSKTEIKTMLATGKRVPRFAGKLEIHTDRSPKGGVSAKRLQDSQLEDPCNGLTKPLTR